MIFDPHAGKDDDLRRNREPVRCAEREPAARARQRFYFDRRIDFRPAPDSFVQKPSRHQDGIAGNVVPAQQACGRMNPKARLQFLSGQVFPRKADDIAGFAFFLQLRRIQKIAREIDTVAAFIIAVDAQFTDFDSKAFKSELRSAPRRARFFSPSFAESFMRGSSISY